MAESVEQTARGRDCQWQKVRALWVFDDSLMYLCQGY